MEIKQYTRKFSSGRTAATISLLLLIGGSIALLSYGIHRVVSASKYFKDYYFVQNLALKLGLFGKLLPYKDFKYALNLKFSTFIDLNLPQFPKDLFINSFITQFPGLAQNTEFTNYLYNNNLLDASWFLDVKQQAEIFEFYNNFCNEVGFSNEKFVEYFEAMRKLQTIECEVVFQGCDYGEPGVIMIVVAGFLAFSGFVLGGMILVNLDYDINNRPLIVRLFTSPEEIKSNQQAIPTV